jgi:polysaccharide export outer membrane protein
VSPRSILQLSLALLWMALQLPQAWSAAPAPVAPLPAPPPAAALDGPGPLVPLGPGDSALLHVYGQPDMDGNVSVGDDGAIRVPLAGAVQVAGLAPDAAARLVEATLKNGHFLVDPHVSLTVTQSLSQRVSVLGEVRTPGRYPVDAKTTVVDLLAQAGGVTELGSDRVYVLRRDKSGATIRYPVILKGLSDPRSMAPTQTLKGGDSLFVPRAEQFSILGEVQKPSMYKLQPDMTVEEAISLAGGLTPKGSERRVDIRRIGPNGEQQTVRVKLGDFLQPNDVVRVKESIF